MRSGGTCSVNTATGNREPIINMPVTSFNIPHSTAFLLSATATDPDGDTINYTWEQTNGSSTSNLPLSTNTVGPLFRSYLPSTNNYRYFPRLQNILINKLTLETNPAPIEWEVLPAVERELNFALVARDNNPNGGQNATENVSISVKNTGPFKVTSQTTAETWTAGEEQTITWDVAGTDANEINTTNVKIIISTDGGQTWDYTLVESTPNNGSYTFTVPQGIGETNNARLMIKPVNNIYLAINPINFAINSPLSVGDINNLDPISITPNPTKGEVKIELNKNFKQVIVNVNDMTGKKVANYNSKVQNTKSHQFNLGHLPNGIYVITINADGVQYTKKLIIKK